MAIQTLRKQFEVYTKKEMENKKLTRELQGMVGHPADREYKGVVSNKLLPDFLFTTNDITNANSIFGPNLAGVRVNRVIKKTSRVDTEEYMKIPEVFITCTSLQRSRPMLCFSMETRP